MIRNPFSILAGLAASLGVDEGPRPTHPDIHVGTITRRERRRSKLARKQQKRSRRANR